MDRRKLTIAILFSSIVLASILITFKLSASNWLEKLPEGLPSWIPISSGRSSTDSSWTHRYIALLLSRDLCNSDTKYLAVGGLAMTVSYILARSISRSNSRTENVGGSSQIVQINPSSLKRGHLDVNKDRDAGEWTPVDFEYPSFPSCPHELKDIKPIPYRPFRWGEYHVTMGIRNMPWGDWIELDSQFAHYHRIRTYRVRSLGADVVRTLPDNPGVVGSAQEAARELVHELAEYLSNRYPTTFHVVRGESRDNGVKYAWYGLQPIKTVTIVPLNVTYNLEEEDPMTVSAMLVQDDLALMIEGSDGRYYFQAGAICVPGFWRLQDKIGMPLDEIHISGHVPQYKEKLHTSLERFFRRLPVDKPVIRNNYFFQIIRAQPLPDQIPPLPSSELAIESLDPEELSWSTTTSGPEKTFSHGRAYMPPERSVPTPSTMRLRSERQTLRRLPRSGAVVFTIRTYLYPIEELAMERGVPGRMASALRGWGEDVKRYKGQALYRDVLLPYLDECHHKQVESGEVGEEEESRVRSAYPF